VLSARISPAARSGAAVRAGQFQRIPRNKVGITGANGSGKSSLIAAIRGELAADPATSIGRRA